MANLVNCGFNSIVSQMRRHRPLNSLRYGSY